jgi:hypothetical protein
MFPLLLITQLSISLAIERGLEPLDVRTAPNQIKLVVEEKLFFILNFKSLNHFKTLK